MLFTETPLKGAFIITPEKFEDARGFFARIWCEREFQEQGLNARLAQCSVSFNRKKGTLRGMHYQLAPHEEVKVVRCTRGAIYDVIVDLRATSPTFGQWFSLNLTADNHQMLYIPKAFAHGFQTLSENTEVFYQMSEFYQPDSAAGIRWNDSAFGIDWPLDVSVISEKDANYRDYRFKTGEV